jgi:hypothetical protein
MDPFRYARTPFGQKLLVGVNWDLLWIPFAAAGAVIVIHLLLRARRRAR